MLIAKKIADLAKPIKVKKGSKRYWKAVAFSLMAWLSVMKEADRTRLKRRENVCDDLEAGL